MSEQELLSIDELLTLMTAVRQQLAEHLNNQHRLICIEQEKNHLLRQQTEQNEQYRNDVVECLEALKVLLNEQKQDGKEWWQSNDLT